MEPRAASLCLGLEAVAVVTSEGEKHDGKRRCNEGQCHDCNRESKGVATQQPPHLKEDHEDYHAASEAAESIRHN